MKKLFIFVAAIMLVGAGCAQKQALEYKPKNGAKNNGWLVYQDVSLNSESFSVEFPADVTVVTSKNTVEFYRNYASQPELLLGVQKFPQLSSSVVTKNLQNKITTSEREFKASCFLDCAWDSPKVTTTSFAGKNWVVFDDTKTMRVDVSTYFDELRLGFGKVYILPENGLSIYPAHYDDCERAWPTTCQDTQRMMESIKFKKN